MRGKETHTDLICTMCGRVMGSKPGVQVTLGLICDDPVCSWQPEPGLHIERDSAIVAAALDGVKVLTVASAAEMSRQRVYQIFEAWRRGV